MARRFAIPETILCVGVLLFAAACSSGGGDSTGSGGAPAAGAAGFVSAGAPGAGGGGGGAPAQGGAAGVAAASGGAMSVPAGMLMCGGKLCHAGGRCAADGSCPAFLGGCFSNVDKFQTCDAYCNSVGTKCAVTSCGPDGSPIKSGYSWVSYPAAGRSDCEKSAAPVTYSFDACASPIWLSPSKPLDDVVRCCCKG